VSPRFRVGFEHEAVSSNLTDKHPDLVPIVDTDTVFAFGKVVALCPDKDTAEMLVGLLNEATVGR
jgi:hypothetical protein